MSTVKNDQGRGVQRSMLETTTYYVVRMSKSASRWLFRVMMELSKKVSWILRNQQSCWDSGRDMSPAAVNSSNSLEALNLFWSHFLCHRKFLVKENNCNKQDADVKVSRTHERWYFAVSFCYYELGLMKTLGVQTPESLSCHVSLDRPS